MPFGNRTGPNGMGSMTGRGTGYCAGYNAPGYATGPGFGAGRGFGRGRGFGVGFGRGRGFRGRFFVAGVQAQQYLGAPAYNVPANASTPVAQQDFKQQEIEALNQEASALEQELNAVKKRLTELEK